MIDFEKIYRTYFNDVYYFILSISKNKEIAEDITSETFFKALKNIDNFRGDSSIKTYLFQIAKNTYFSYLKKDNRDINLENFEILIEESINAEDEVIKKEEKSDLNNLVNSLKEPHRSIVKFRVWEEMSFKDIGNIYGKSENWACVTFHRAKKTLKESWDKDNE